MPGQVITEDILTFLKALDVKEIHGYRPELGLRVFKAELLALPEDAENQDKETNGAEPKAQRASQEQNGGLAAVADSAKDAKKDN